MGVLQSAHENRGPHNDQATILTSWACGLNQVVIITKELDKD